MLQSIRDRLSGPIVWVIIGLIAIPFAFVGIDTFNSGGADPIVAKVGGQKITSSQLEAAYQQRLQRLQQMLGENFRSDMIDPASFRQGVLKEMVQETALQQHADKSGYTASDAAIIKTIETIPAFQVEGKFSSEAYRAALATQGLTPQRFEKQLREGLGTDQIRDGVVASAFVTPAEAAAAWRLARQERSFVSATLKPASYEDQITVSEDDIAKHYADHADRYKAPERLKLKVVELDLSKLPEAPAPEAAVLKAIYDADTNPFSSSEERKARHILVAFGADKSAGSKSAGGDLGWVRKGLMTPRFEEALFGLGKGEISAPVETEFGWHLIQLEDVKPAVTKPFEDAAVQAQLLANYRKRDLDKRYQELSEKIEQLAFENPGSLEPVAAGVGSTVETTDWFTRTSGSGLTANRAVLDAAFSTEVLEDGENSKPLSVGDNRIAVIRKAEYEPAHTLKLEEVKDRVRAEIRTARATEKATAEADALLKAAEAGGTLAALAAERKLTVAQPGSVRRDATGIDRKLLDAVFRLPRPAAGKTSVGKATLDDGAIAVIALEGVKDATPEPEDAGFKQQSSQLKDALAGAEFASFRADLEKNLKVEIKVAAPTEPVAPDVKP